MENKNLWSRRKFSKAALSLQILIGSGLINIPTGCGPKKKSNNGELLSSSFQRILKLAMDDLIPNADDMPAASEVGGVEYILNILKENPDLVSSFQYVLSQLDNHSVDSKNDDFEELNKKARIGVLNQYENDQPELFNVLKDFVYESYYINEKVWELIGYEPYPTLSTGPEMEPFDEKLLERVKQMPPFYTKTRS